MTTTAILGTGHYVPSKVVTNHDLAKIMPTSDEWIQQRTGIQERHYVDWVNDPMDGTEMGTRAAKQALEMAKVAPEDIDLVIWGTLSPDHMFPGSSCWAQPKIGIKPGTPAIDVRNQCSFFIYGLTLADAMIKAGHARRVLVVGSEIHSTSLEYNERGRDVAVIFGDGAGAVVLGPPTEEGQGILTTDIHSDGQFAKELQVAWGPGDGPDWWKEDILNKDGRAFPKMNGKYVFKHAVTRMHETLQTSLGKAGKTMRDVDMLICHQANLRIVEFVQTAYEIPDEKVYNNIQRYGNTTAASIPIALDECVRSGKVKRGDLLALVAFGAGFTWGSAVIRF
jgi:3-oxoacyl-[acyl-carrier-protein] synthase III